jgi:hypothetical protein
MPSWSTQGQNECHVCGYLQNYLILPLILLKEKIPACRWVTRFMGRRLHIAVSKEHINFCIITTMYASDWGSRWRSWLRHCSTSRKVAGSIPDCVIDILIDIILPVALWPWGWLSLQQKWVPGIFPGGKGSRWVGLTTLPPSCTECLEIREPQPPGTLRACPGL